MWKILTLTGLCLMSCISAWAHGALWADNEQLRQVNKVVILPFEGPRRYYGGEAYLQDALSKRNKDTQFILVADAQGNPQEIARRYGANAYVITYIRENDVRQDWSPDLKYSYNYRYYKEETNGPHGTRRHDDHSYYTTQYFNGCNVAMQKVNMDFVMYNTNGNVIMTMQDRNYSYSNSEESLTKDILKEMAISWRDAKKDAKSPISFSCEITDVPSNVQEDSFLTNALDYTIEYESTNYKKIPSSDSYYVTAAVHNYSEDWQWSAPYVSTSMKEISSHSFKWKDHDGKEHTGYVHRYETVADYVPGHYNVQGKVSATLNLVNSRTNQIVLSHTGTATHAKEIDSFREIVRDFYKKVAKQYSN